MNRMRSLPVQLNFKKPLRLPDHNGAVLNQPFRLALNSENFCKKKESRFPFAEYLRIGKRQCRGAVKRRGNPMCGEIFEYLNDGL